MDLLQEPTCNSLDLCKNQLARSTTPKLSSDTHLRWKHQIIVCRIQSTLKIKLMFTLIDNLSSYFHLCPLLFSSLGPDNILSFVLSVATHYFSQKYILTHNSLNNLSTSQHHTSLGPLLWTTYLQHLTPFNPQALLGLFYSQALLNLSHSNTGSRGLFPLHRHFQPLICNKLSLSLSFTVHSHPQISPYSSLATMFLPPNRLTTILGFVSLLCFDQCCLYQPLFCLFTLPECTYAWHSFLLRMIL